jgi:preprotein translocase subunit SecG
VGLLVLEAVVLVEEGLSGFLKGRGQANGLVKFTVLLGTVFFITSLSLSIINSYNSKSVIDSVADDILEDTITSEDPVR